MKIFMSCPECNFQISPEMKAAIKEGKCPSCGAAVEMNDIDSVFLLLETCTSLGLPLTAGELHKFATVFLLDKLKCTFPEFTVEDEVKDKMRIAAARQQPKAPQSKTKKRPESPVDNDFDDVEDPEVSEEVGYADADTEEVFSSEESPAPRKRKPADSTRILAPPPNPKNFNKGIGKSRDDNEKGISFLDPNEITMTRGIDISGAPKKASTADDINAAAKAETERLSAKNPKNIV